jgi:phosphohistidine phosphatase
MALYLVQHGKNLPAEDDPEKSLSPEGISDVKRIANLARDYGVHVGQIEHSGKKRAKQTAEMYASVLNPEGGVRQREGMNPLDDVVPLAEEMDRDDDLMLVGHLPFMERLTSYLVIGTIEKRIFRFQNGGIVCLDMDRDPDGWVIKWALLPAME